MISNNLIQLNIEYFCDLCDKTNKSKSKIIPLKSLTHIQYEKRLRINHSFKIPCCFDVDKIFNDYIICHNKKLDSHFFKCDFNLVFNSFPNIIKLMSVKKTTFLNLKDIYCNGSNILLKEDISFLVLLKWKLQLSMMKKIRHMNIFLNNQCKLKK